MGVSYSFYLEGFVDGGWKCACPKTTKESMAFHFHGIIEGKSFLREIFESFCTAPVAASLELKQCCGDVSFWLFDIEKAQKFAASHFYENAGYVEKSAVQDYKDNFCQLSSSYDIDEWLTAAEFRALDAESQKAYVYFEWTNHYGILNVLREIFVIAEKYKEIFEYSQTATEYRIVVGVD